MVHLLDKGSYIYWKKRIYICWKRKVHLLEKEAHRFNRYFVLRKGDEYANQGNTWVKRQTDRLRKETDRFREKISARVNILVLRHPGRLWPGCLFTILSDKKSKQCGQDPGLRGRYTSPPIWSLLRRGKGIKTR
jgi:hypothetical protein